LKVLLDKDSCQTLWKLTEVLNVDKSNVNKRIKIKTMALIENEAN
jgi:hypothetical protein